MHEAKTETIEDGPNTNRLIETARNVGAIACLCANIYFIRRGVETGFDRETLGLIAGTGIVGNALEGKEHLLNIIRGHV